MSPLIVVGVTLLLAALAYLMLRNRGHGPQLLKQEIDQLRQSQDGNIRQINDQLGKLTGEIGNRLQESLKHFQEANRSVGDRLDNAARVVGEVQNRLGKLEVATQQVHAVGREIATLQETLRAPKFRGGFGEFLLNDLLAQILPRGSYELQYGFRTGERVDAVIHTQEGMIPVDSKFPYANFKRMLEAKAEEEKKPARREFLADVRKHVDDIGKYIRPDEGTLPFALMYIPAENVYYEAIIKDEDLEADLLSYCQKKRVFPVSPNSFHAYLQTIAIGFRGMKIEEWAQSLDASLERLKEDLTRFADEFGQIGGHLKNARQKYETAERRLDNFQEKLVNLEAPGSPASETEKLKALPGAQ